MSQARWSTYSNMSQKHKENFNLNYFENNLDIPITWSLSAQIVHLWLILFCDVTRPDWLSDILHYKLSSITPILQTDLMGGEICDNYC